MMVWGKIIGQTTKKESGPEGKAIRDFDRLETALLKTTTMIKAKKDLPALLEHVARESLHSLLAHRASVFVMDDNSGVLTAPFSFVANPQYEQVGLLEEKEVARRAIKQNKTFLLREQKEFSEFFKYEGRDRKITSLISIPIPEREKISRVLSVVLIDGSRRFHEKDLDLLSIFINHLHIAIENAYLHEEARKAAGFRSDYEKYLDDILSQLLSLQENERQRIDGHIIKLLPDEKIPEPTNGTNSTNGDGNGEMEPIENSEGLEGILFALEEDGSIRQNESGEKICLEFEEEDLGIAGTSAIGTAFVRTPNPMDLGDLFLLKLYLNDSREPMMVQGKVIWTNKYGQDKKHLRRGMGVKFMNLQPEEQKRIENYNCKRKAAAEKTL